ncbi:MAG: hypothetical protein AAB518_02220 [Patescibacteria group bacterium]
MKIYVVHSREFDFKKELYDPIKQSSFYGHHEIILPHDGTDAAFKSKDLFRKGCDLVIAEVSYPSTGLGIELGWAEMFRIPIVALYKKDSKVSGSITTITNNIFEYGNAAELLMRIEGAINELK